MLFFKFYFLSKDLIKNIMNSISVRSMILWVLLCSCSISSQNNNLQKEKVYNVIELGAISDGKTLNTKVLQNIIDDCSKKGGGTILFPKGIYLSGTLYLKSNITFEISKGAVLLGSSNMRDYQQHFIFAKDVENFKITGKGIIDGQGKSFWTEDYKAKERPIGWIFIENGKNITIEDITLQNSPSHVVVLETCQNVYINHITILNDKQSPNTDGIDVINSSSVKIKNSFFSTGDDAICLKSKDKLIQDVTVENCVLESDDAGLKFGTGSAIGIKNCIFKNVQIRNTRYGIALFMKDGGVFENNTFEEIIIQTNSRHKTDYPIFIDIDKREEQSTLGIVRNMYFKNIKMITRGNNLIAGHPKQFIESLHFENIDMTVLDPVNLSKMKKPKGNKDHDYHTGSADYAPINADFTFANTKKLTLKNIRINKNIDEEDFKRKDFFFENVDALEWDDKKAKQISYTKP
jgi:polygalacturonase